MRAAARGGASKRAAAWLRISNVVRYSLALISTTLGTSVLARPIPLPPLSALHFRLCLHKLASHLYPSPQEKELRIHTTLCPLHGHFQLISCRPTHISAPLSLARHAQLAGFCRSLSPATCLRRRLAVRAVRLRISSYAPCVGSGRVLVH